MQRNGHQIEIVIADKATESLSMERA